MQSYTEMGGYNGRMGGRNTQAPRPIPAVSNEGRATLMQLTRFKMAAHYQPNRLAQEYSRTLNAKYRRELVMDTEH